MTFEKQIQFSARTVCRLPVIILILLISAVSAPASAGLPGTTTLQVVKYDDVNRNGLNDEVDTGPGGPPTGATLAGWEFTLFETDGSRIQSVVTSVEDATNDFGVRASFRGLLEGNDYIVCETEQFGWVNTDPGILTPRFDAPCKTLSITASTGPTVTEFFGNYESDTFHLRVIKYDDVNRNGDSDEVDMGPFGPPTGATLTGWEFTVYDDQGNVVGVNTTSVENPTNDLGVRAGFPDLPKSETLTVCETPQFGWVNSEPGMTDPAYAVPCKTQNFSSAGSSQIVLFGNYEADTFDLRVIKYDDVNRNGDRDEVDTGSSGPPTGATLTGWEFTVYDDQGNVVGVNTTSVENPIFDLGVRAGFPDLPKSETLTVCETPQFGWVNSEPGMTDPTYAVPCKTQNFSLSVSSAFMYFGNYESDTFDLRVIKYDDVNRNGDRDEVDTGPFGPPTGATLTGWEFTVYDDQGNVVGVNTTSVENPIFDLGVRAGFPDLPKSETLTVCETPQFGWVNSEPGMTDPTYAVPCKTQNFSLSVSSAFMYFGNYESDTFDLRVIKYDDVNRNGDRDEVDTGPFGPPTGATLTGWEFTVYDDQGNVVGVNTTSVENPIFDLGVRAGFPDLPKSETLTVCETPRPFWVNSEPGTIDPNYNVPCKTQSYISAGSLALVYFGNYEVPGVMVLPDPLEFGDIALGSSSMQMLIVENIGAGALELVSLDLSGLQSGDFGIVDSNCPPQIAAGEFCGVDIEFAPSQPGFRTAILNLSSNALSSPDQVMLIGSNDVLFADGFEVP